MYVNKWIMILSKIQKVLVASNIQNPTAAAVDFWILVLNKYWYLATSKIQNLTAAAVEFWILVWNKKMVPPPHPRRQQTSPARELKK